MQAGFKLLASYVALGCEAGTVIILGIAALEAGVLLVRRMRQLGDITVKRRIWVRFASWIVLALEFALAADIVDTAITPTWNELGQLAAVAAIRTGLNFFLERDIEDVWRAGPGATGADRRFGMTEPHARAAAPEANTPRTSVLGEIIEHPIEVITAVSLSMAALLTSWSAYHAAIWDGVESAQFTRAEALRTQSAQLATRAGQLQGFDIFMAGQWLNAYADGNQHLQTFYQARFRPEFKPAFQAWLATRPLQNPDAPASPFVMPQYRLAMTAQAGAAERQAAQAFARGEEAKRHSNAFIQITVVLASAMFFGGIGQVFKVRHVRVALMVISVLTCLWAVYRVATLPIV